LSEHKLKSVLADICDLQENVYRCVDKTTCCKVGPPHLIVSSLVMIMMLMTAIENSAVSSSSYIMFYLQSWTLGSVVAQLEVRHCTYSQQVAVSTPCWGLAI